MGEKKPGFDSGVTRQRCHQCQCRVGLEGAGRLLPVRFPSPPSPFWPLHVGDTLSWLVSVLGSSLSDLIALDVRSRGRAVTKPCACACSPNTILLLMAVPAGLQAKVAGGAIAHALGVVPEGPWPSCPAASPEAQTASSAASGGQEGWDQGGRGYQERRHFLWYHHEGCSLRRRTSRGALSGFPKRRRRRSFHLPRFGVLAVEFHGWAGASDGLGGESWGMGAWVGLRCAR